MTTLQSVQAILKANRPTPAARLTPGSDRMAIPTISQGLSTRNPPLTADARRRDTLRAAIGFPILIEEIKSVPYAPVSHLFVERLIGTVRRAYLDRVFFWNVVDLTRKLEEFRDYYNGHRMHRSLGGTTPAQRTGASSPAPAAFDRYVWRQHCRGLFQIPIAA